MTAEEVMDELYPSLPAWQREANADWLDSHSELVVVGGYITSPRDHWIVRKIGEYEFEIVDF